MVVDQEHTGIMRKKTHPRQLGVPLNRWGRNLISCCPFHSPEETSLFFYDALGYWRYRCLQCGSEGDLVEFVMRSRFNGLEEPAARAEAMEFLGAQEHEQDSDPDEHPWIKEIGGEKSRVLENFVRYCHWAACKSPSSAEFFESRGWSIGQAQLYGLGYYSGDPEPFYSYCMLSGIERHQVSFYLDNLEAYHEPRITIPARNSKGLIHSVYGRSMEDDGEHNPYISYASGPVDIPFNIQPDNDNPIIVEGMFDALTADLAGIPGVVSTMYQDLTMSHLYKLKACGANSVTLILRRDANRRSQEYRIQDYLKMAETQGLKFKSIVLPKDETVDLLVRNYGADHLLNLINETEEDTVHTHRRSMLLQDIKENFDTAMGCPPDESVGYPLNTFPQLSRDIDGIQSGIFYVSSNPFNLKTSLLSSFALDLIETNKDIKLIYIALETPRRQIFDRMIAMLTGLSVLDVRKKNTDEEVNARILEATRALMGYVRDNRLEIWEDQPSFDNKELLATLKEEQREHAGLVVIIDGIDHFKVTDRPDLADIHERRSSVMLDIYKTLDIPLFIGGEIVDENGALIAPRAYLRDSDAIYWLESKDGELALNVNSKRLGNNNFYNGKLSIDPQSNRIQEA
ncbi:DnaB-like helicase C terminal domain-containing protein [Fibrobacter sp. UWR3]|uniref:CHC2 zinc finger domain-containing protein n=1 Tax=Fibrobacter sp. UWR3 TaxID=1896217 RepID=UPI0009122018|nr:CHC2 zinc finger domain-containing protein [Fibrobacter sp. UWR3]SHM43274.1 DnaB-like helicase C terminal domain-containing protein [Fibrobacter sp. UWR3]